MNKMRSKRYTRWSARCTHKCVPVQLLLSVVIARISFVLCLFACVVVSCVRWLIAHSYIPYFGVLHEKKNCFLWRNCVMLQCNCDRRTALIMCRLQKQRRIVLWEVVSAGYRRSILIFYFSLYIVHESSAIQSQGSKGDKHRGVRATSNDIKNH